MSGVQSVKLSLVVEMVKLIEMEILMFVRCFVLMIDFDQGDSGGPLIATATRHSNSTQKRFIFKQTNYILVFYRQVFLGRHRELWCWLR